MYRNPEMELTQSELEQYLDKTWKFHHTTKYAIKAKDMDLRNAYLWDTPRDCQDGVPVTGEEHVIYGLHSYGGYWAFFRPDLTEVFNLLSDILPVSQLDLVDKIFVTTCPLHDDACENLDPDTDKHYGVSTVYILWK